MRSTTSIGWYSHHHDCNIPWPGPKFSRSNCSNGYFDKQTVNKANIAIASDWKYYIWHRMVPLQMFYKIALIYNFYGHEFWNMTFIFKVNIFLLFYCYKLIVKAAGYLRQIVLDSHGPDAELLFVLFISLTDLPSCPSECHYCVNGNCACRAGYNIVNGACTSKRTSAKIW